jgi:8-oxo-dGTP pyrophosphatase MutT (NUDIX family)
MTPEFPPLDRDRIAMIQDDEPSWCRDDDHSDETLAASWLLSLKRRRFRSKSSGRPHDFFVIELADAVNVVAVTPEREVLLVRQFRAGSERDSLETPGGLLDAGEAPEVAGARELLEETGYAGGPPRVLGTVWSNASLLTSRTTFILIENVRRVAEPHLDAGEEMTLEIVPAERIPGLIRSGAIDHALAVNSLLFWLLDDRLGPTDNASTEP